MKKKIQDKVKKFYKNSIKYRDDKVLKKDLDKLPRLIQDYFRKINLIGKERIKRVRLSQKGLFKLKPDSKWKPFSAEQYVNTEDWSFLWYAKIKMIPLVNFHVVDEFIEGKGALKAKLFNLITVVDEEGEKLDQGEFLRFISEAPWYPSFYLNEKIVWNKIDETTMELTITMKQNQISGKILFDNLGFIKEVTAKRYYTNQNNITFEDWHGFYEGYKEFNGILIPTDFKVCWHLESGNYCYIKGKILNIEFN
ncbi:MAG: hypothetical protein EU531_11240 [Promethearchaeota archaeon]|nr:MAG: hypothetical protein EU531_11240 [Candidatus Lokiarchaeota archaeon]